MERIGGDIPSGIYVTGATERVVYGRPTREAIQAEVDRLRLSRAFIAISGTLARDTEVLAELRQALGARIVGVFDQCIAHSPQDNVLDLAKAVRASEADIVIAIGGGTVIDSTKVATLCVSERIESLDELAEYASQVGGGAKPLRQAVAPRQFAVPTTLSGAEFSDIAGATDPRTKVKAGFRAPELRPRVVILDPGLARHTVDWLWFSTGIRAVDHAVEGFLAPSASAYIRGQCLAALNIFARALRQARSEPDDLYPRSEAQQAVWLASSAIGRVSMGASHGIGYVLGAAFNVPHGYTSCVMLPAVLAWNAQQDSAAQAPIADALGTPNLNAADSVRQLISDLGLPRWLEDVGVAANDLEEIAARAAEISVVRANSRPVTNAADVLEILQLAL